MGSRDRIDLPGTEQRAKKGVPEVTRRLFDPLLIGGCVRRSIAAMRVKFEIVDMRQNPNELLIGVGIGPAKSVVDVRDRQHQAKISGTVDQSAKQSHRIRPT